MLALNNSTVTGNSATGGGGGGLYLWNGTTATLNRTIVTGNSAPAGAEIQLQGGTLNLNNSNVLGHSGLTNALAFAGFTPPAGSDVIATSNGGQSTALTSILNTTLADNDGPTPTHALVSGSPAIDYIPTTDANCNPGVTRDQRGALRASGGGFGGSACDVGAFEFESTISFPVTASTGSGNGEISPAAQELLAGSNAVFTVTPDPGWSVLSVTGDTCSPASGVGNEWVAENITQACAVEASFVINTYVVTANTGAGQGSITPVVQVTDHGADATFTVTPQTGWSVTTVVGNTCTPVQGVGNQWVASNITEACSVTANFSQDTFNVTTAVAAGQGDITPPSQNVAFGGTAGFAVTPDIGWSVDDVTGDTCAPASVGGTAWEATNIQDDCAVEASFVINSYIVSAAVGTGVGSITPPSQSVDHGDNATFTVTPDTGWSVTTVDGDTCTPVFDSGDQWIAADITEDCAVTADFAQDTFEVTASVAAGEGSISPSTQSVTFGGTANFMVAPETGWSIDSVVGDTCTPELASGDEWQATGIQEACAVEASFVINTYTVTAETGEGEGTITPPSQDVEHGGDALFTITPNATWSISSVTGDTCTPVLDSGDQWIATDIIEDCTVVAEFLQDVYTVGGQVSGLAGTGLELTLNDEQVLPIGSDGDFTFPDPLVDGSDYNVTVLTQPSGQFCLVTNGSGTLDGAEVNDVLVTCENLVLGFSLDSIQFNTLLVEQGTEQALVLTNTGAANLVIEQFEAPQAPFGLNSADCAPLPRNLAPGESCTVQVSFTPTAAGNFGDSLLVVSNAMDSPQNVNLSGTAQAQPIPIPATGPLALLLLMLSLLVLGTRQVRRK